MSDIKNLTSLELNELFDIYISYYKSLKSFCNKNKKKIRYPNFPEELSENIIKYYIINYESKECVNARTGDLCIMFSDLTITKETQKVHKKIEVKCFSSTGPTSFGPTECWDEIYFLDAINFIDNKFKIYKCKLSHDSELWSNIKINKNETYRDVCKSKRRPRISFTNLYQQLNEDIKLVYEGDFDKIINKTN